MFVNRALSALFGDGKEPAERAAVELADARRRMVESQMVSRGIANPRVLEAMGRVPREEFVPEAMRSQAFDDSPLPIGEGQTISQPYTVAFMAEAAGLQGGERVLEVGAGCGYGAAVLGEIARSVVTIERIASLAEETRRRLQRLGYANIQVIEGDGTTGWPAGAPYDAIVVTAGGAGIPLPLVEQLAEGGRLVIPLGGDRTEQAMWRFTRHGGQLRMENLGGFRFVPLIGRCGWES